MVDLDVPPDDALATLGDDETLREVLGAGTLGIVFGDRVLLAQPFGFFQQAPGAFVALGILLGLMNAFGKDGR